MPPPRKRKRSTSPPCTWKPTDIFRLKAYFRKHSLDVTAPCTAARNALTTSAERALQKRCWVVRNVSLWNGLLHPVGIELRENVSGKLTLQTFFKCNPSATGYRVVCAFLVKKLLNDHYCVQQVDLSYAGELFGDKSLLMTQVRPNAGLQQITLDGRQVSKLELSKLVRVVLRGDPVQMGLRYASLGTTEVAALSRSLETATRLTDLDLSANGLSGCGNVGLLGAIETSKTIKCIKLDFNMIGVRGAQRFAKLLKINQTLLRVSLFKTKIKDKGAVAIGEALKENSTLEFLMLGCNSIGTMGAKAIASSIRENKSLVCLDLRQNSLGNGGAIFIAQILRSNEALRELHLCRNAIGDDGIVAIANSLANNRTLHWLSIHENEFRSDGLQALARLVAFNSTLTRLNATSRHRQSSAEQFTVFAEALANNRKLEGIEASVWCSAAMESLSQTLRCHETLRHLSIYTDIPELGSLFSGLAVNRSVRTFELHSFLSMENVKGFADLLRATTTIRSVYVSYRLCNRSLMQLVHALAFNASVSRFRVGSQSLGVSLCGAIGDMLAENETLTVFILDSATVDEAGLTTLASGLTSNRFMQQLSVGYPASSAAGFAVSEHLRRNSTVLNQAVQFALRTATDRTSAAAFQLHQRTEFFAHELSLIPEVADLSAAKALIREAHNFILHNYFVVTGVVKRDIICPRPRRTRSAQRTQFDELNAYCLYAIASCLKVSDVKC
ncbi:unnamed protein product [Ixodes hexagonus]